jgi:hypothetical protein
MKHVFKKIVMISVFVGAALLQQVAFCMNQQTNANEMRWQAAQFQETSSEPTGLLAVLRSVKNWVVTHKKPLLIGAVVIVGITCLVAAGYVDAGTKKYFDITTTPNKPPKHAPVSHFSDNIVTSEPQPSVSTNSLDGNTAPDKASVAMGIDAATLNKPRHLSADAMRLHCKDRTGEYTCNLLVVNGKGGFHCSYLPSILRTKMEWGCQKMIQLRAGSIFHKYGYELVIENLPANDALEVVKKSVL